MVNPTVAIMGMTGAGKSYFVQQLTGRSAGASTSLESATSQIMAHRAMLNGVAVNVIDTPGFDDTYCSDDSILLQISSWLADEYRSSRKLTGIVFVFDVSLARMSGSMMKFNGMFRALCGESFYRNVIIATNRWDKVTPSVGESVVEQLKEKYYSVMIQRGTRLTKFDGTSQGAESIVTQLLGLKAAVMQHQVDIVDLGKQIGHTAAAEAMVRYEVEELKKKQAKELEVQRQKLLAQVKQKERELERRRTEQRRMLEAQLARARDDVKRAKDKAKRDDDDCTIL